MRKAPVKICLALLVALCVTAQSPAQQPVEEIQQLDEIWVRGEHLSRTIEDAEDEFFKLYNQLNKNGKYDVFCGQMELHSGSMIMVRHCIPGFIVYNAYDPRRNSVSLAPAGQRQQCNGMHAVRDAFNGDVHYENSCFGTSGIAEYTGVEPELLAAAGRPAYAQNVFRVVSSDARLQEKARNLGTLYDEMQLTQRHYVKLQSADRSARSTRRNAKPAGGPHSL